MNRDLLMDDPEEFTREILKVTLHEKQGKYIANRAQFKNALWGRRAGKSTVDAVDLLHWAFKYPGIPQYNLSYSHDQALISFGYAESIMEKCGLSELLDSEPVHSPFGLMKFVNGSTIHARSLQHRGKFVRGKGAARVKVDEAGIIPDNVIEEVVMPMLTDWDGQMCKSGTPWGRGHFHKSYHEGIATKSRPAPLKGNFSLHCPSWENPNISRGYIERMKRKMSEIQFRTEYGAEWMDELGRVFGWKIIQRCFDIAEVLEAAYRNAHVYVAGWDFAKHLDWTVGYVLDVTNPDDIRMVWKDRFQKESYEYVAKRVREVSEMYHVSATCVDSTGVGEVLVDRLRGVVPNLEAFTFSVQSKGELINNLKILMEQGRLHFDFDRDLVDELTYYEYELSGRSGNVLMGTQDEHDDCVTALALAAWAFEANSVEPAVRMV